MSPPFRVGLLGMGRIAAGLDNPHGPAVNTHLKAIISEPRLTVTHVADSDCHRARDEARRFGLSPLVVAPASIVTADVDALCIATGDGTHLSYVERAAAGSVRVVLSEKPLDGDAHRRQEAVAALAARGAVLAVNHTRRWIPGLAEWIAQARRAAFGRAVAAVAIYDRGFRHNGTHCLDLVAAFISKRASEVRSIAAPIADFGKEDPTRSLQITLATETGPVPLMMVGCDGRVQSVFSVDIRFERARVLVFNEGGVRAELHRSADIAEPGFSPELLPVKRFHDDPPRLFGEVWRNIADHLESGVRIACANEDALAGYDLADTIVARHPI